MLTGSLLLLFIFWEITALCSYALIAFDNDNPAAVRGGIKALIITQLGGVVIEGRQTEKRDDGGGDPIGEDPLVEREEEIADEHRAAHAGQETRQMGVHSVWHAAVSASRALAASIQL